MDNIRLSKLTRVHLKPYTKGGRWKGEEKGTGEKEEEERQEDEGGKEEEEKVKDKEEEVRKGGRKTARRRRGRGRTRKRDQLFYYRGLMVRTNQKQTTTF